MSTRCRHDKGDLFQLNPRWSLETLGRRGFTRIFGSIVRGGSKRTTEGKMSFSHFICASKELFRFMVRINLDVVGIESIAFIAPREQDDAWSRWMDNTISYWAPYPLLWCLLCYFRAPSLAGIFNQDFSHFSRLLPMQQCADRRPISLHRLKPCFSWWLSSSSSASFQPSTDPPPPLTTPTNTTKLVDGASPTTLP